MAQIDKGLMNVEVYANRSVGENNPVCGLEKPVDVIALIDGGHGQSATLNEEYLHSEYLTL
jgi:hypothetical protein